MSRNRGGLIWRTVSAYNRKDFGRVFVTILYMSSRPNSPQPVQAQEFEAAFQRMIGSIYTNLKELTERVNRLEQAQKDVVSKIQQIEAHLRDTDDHFSGLGQQVNAVTGRLDEMSCPPDTPNCWGFVSPKRSSYYPDF